MNTYRRRALVQEFKWPIWVHFLIAFAPLAVLGVVMFRGR